MEGTDPTLAARLFTTGPGSVLSFLRPGLPWGDDVMTTFCHYVLQFAGPATAQRWTAAHPGTFVTSLGDAAELARRHAARAFAAGAMTSP